MMPAAWLARVREDIAAERVSEPVAVSSEAKSRCGECFLPHGTHDSICSMRVEPNSA